MVGAGWEDELGGGTPGPGDTPEARGWVSGTPLLGSGLPWPTRGHVCLQMMFCSQEPWDSYAVTPAPGGSLRGWWGQLSAPEAIVTFPTAMSPGLWPTLQRLERAGHGGRLGRSLGSETHLCTD